MFVDKESVEGLVLSESASQDKRRDFLKKVLGIRDQEESTKEETFEDKMEKLMVERAYNLRIMAIFFMMTNTMFGIAGLECYSTGTTEEIVMQDIYWGFLVIESILISLSFRKNGVKFIRPAYKILLIRNILRLYDFEKSGLVNNMMTT